MILNNISVIKNTDTSRIVCDVDNKQIFVEFDSSLLDYVSLNYDGFLLIVLQIAMKNNEDIIIDGLISYKLYYNLQNYVMKIIQLIFPALSIINIIPKGFYDDIFTDNKAIATALSCGVDSLCCVEDYYFNMTNKNNKLTHVTNFFAGAYSSINVFKKKLEHVKKYVDNTDLKLITATSNMTDINNLDHAYTCVFRSLSIPLFFQKLFKKYYFSAACSFKDSKISDDLGIADAFLIHLLSTENLEFVSHGCQYTRIEKTLRIHNNKLTHSFLDVCVDENYFGKSDHINCSQCWKCVRTLLVLDFYNIIDLYSKCFNFDIYRNNKNNYLKKLNKNNALDLEVYNLYNKL